MPILKMYLYQMCHTGMILFIMFQINTQPLNTVYVIKLIC